MYRQYCPRLAGNDGLLDANGIDQQRRWVNIHENYTKTAIQWRSSAGDEGEVRYNDFPAILKPIMVEHRSKPDAQRICPVRQQQAVPTTAIRRPLLSKLFRQWLREAFDTSYIYSPKKGARFELPAQEISLVHSSPRTKAHIP